MVDNTVTPLFIEVDGYKAFNEAGYKEALSSEGNKFIVFLSFTLNILLILMDKSLVEISKYKVDNDSNITLSFCRADGSERDYVDIGIYYSSNNIDSIAGVNLRKKQDLNEQRTRNKFGEDTDFIYSTETIWTRRFYKTIHSRIRQQILVNS